MIETLPVERRQYGFSLERVVHVNKFADGRPTHSCWHIARYNGNRHAKWDGVHHRTFADAWRSLASHANEMHLLDMVR